MQNNMRELYGILNLLDQEKFAGARCGCQFCGGVSLAMPLVHSLLALGIFKVRCIVLFLPHMQTRRSFWSSMATSGRA